MIRKVVVSLGVIFIALTAFHAEAKHMAIEYQQGEYDRQGVRVAVQPRGERPLPWWGLSWYPELSVSQWQQRIVSASYDGNSYDRVNVLAISPVFVKPLITLGSGQLSFEFGIGASLLDERYFGHKHLGTHFQFEDRLGLRWVTPSEHTITLRYMHYSNGGIGSHNPGVDFINLSYGRAF